MRSAVTAVLEKKEKSAMSKMFVKDGYQNESIAFALAAGYVCLDDQDGSKARRRQRYERSKGSKNTARSRGDR